MGVLVNMLEPEGFGICGCAGEVANAWMGMFVPRHEVVECDVCRCIPPFGKLECPLPVEMDGGDGVLRMEG